MTPTRILIGAAAVALVAGAAHAQSGPMSPSQQAAQEAAAQGTTWTGPLPGPSASSSMDHSTMNSSSSMSSSTQAAPSASSMGADASVTASAATMPTPEATVTMTTVTNGPVPDTAENRAKYGQPMSRAGKMTRAAGN